MKTKLILMAIFAASLGVAAGWLAPHRLAPAAAAVDGRKILYYACPMHPTIKYDKPGNCPICGMKLEPIYAEPAGTSAPAGTPACCSPTTTP